MPKAVPVDLKRPGRRVRPERNKAGLGGFLVMAAVALHLGACRSSDQARESPTQGLVSSCLNLDQPILTLGAWGAPSEVYFREVRSATEFADRSIAVADYLSGRLWLFSSAGAIRATLEGPPGAPGAFMSLWGTQRGRGDTLLAFDNMKAELTYVLPDGGVGRAKRLPRSGRGLSSVAGIANDGSAIMVVSSAPGKAVPPGSSGVSQDSVEVWVVSEGGEVSRVIGPFPGDERYLDLRESFSAMLLPFGRRTTVVVSGSRVVIGTGERPEVELFDIQSGKKTILSVPLRSAEVDGEDIERYKEAWINGAGTDDRRRIRRRIADGIPFPPLSPPYVDILTDPSGPLWIQIDDRAGNGSPQYLVIDTTGVVNGTVSIPDGVVRLLDIGPTWILGLVRDSLDVESVAVYSRECRG